MGKDSDAKNERNIDIGGGVSGGIIKTGDETHYHYDKALEGIEALHQLPPPTADFVGRKKEMKELLKAVEKSGMTISGLQGLGGVGKTALTLKLADHLKPNYPDAQFYLDLKGASKQPLSAGEAMAHVIRSYHPMAQLPEDENGVRAIYLSVLNGKRTLLLMDNAANRDQVLPLIPPDGCIMLITSRNRFTLGGFFVKHLDALEPKDAKRLLLKIAPRIGNHADQLAKLCGYLPLVLELAASALHKFVNLTPDEYVHRLTETKKRLEFVEASLSLSYDLLTEEMQRLWRTLAVFPNTFDDAAAASLWQLNFEDTQDLLAELIAYSLIEWNETTRRYRLHDLLRLFADARLSEQERLSARQAHASFFQDLLAQADDLYLQGSEEMTRGLTLFDLERENIEAGQTWAASLIGKDDTASRLIRDYDHAGLYILELRLHPRERISWLETTLKAARLLKDQSAEGTALGNLGIAYAALGETRKAIEFHEQALLIVREIGDRRSEGTALGNLGIDYAALGEPDKAIEFYLQHLEIARKIGNRLGEGTALGNLGNTYADLGETHKAIEFLQQHLEIARKTGDRRGEGNALGNLGIAYADLGETRKAIGFYEQTLEIVREIGDRRGEGNALGNLGAAYAALGELDKAIEFFHQRIEIDCEIGDRRGEGNAYWNSALAYDKLGDRTQAIAFAEMALEIFEQIESPHTSKVRSTLEEWKAEETE